MRQKINELFTSGSTCQKTVPQPTLAPAAFNTNQNGTLCLPLMSENQKIIWVHSDQINIQGDKVGKLDEAFSRFPYLTQKQTISLAQSCSLHPDQVKVWFMAQRLCYGISWDSKDINEVRRKMLGRTTPKRKVQKFESETIKKPKLSRGEVGGAEEEVARNLFEIKKETVINPAIGIEINAQKKQRVRKRKSAKRKDEVLDFNATKHKIETAEANSHALLDSYFKPDITPLQIDGENSFPIPDEALDRSPSVIFPSQVAPLGKLEKEEMETSPINKGFTQESPTCSNLDKSSVKKQRLMCQKTLDNRIKTEKQRAIMKMEFAKYQYPSAEQYQKLSMLTGLPRPHLVQWFNDMRYSIKKAKPTWLSVEQHKRAVASVVREQNIRKMNKMRNSLETQRSPQVEKYDCPKSV